MKSSAIQLTLKVRDLLSRIVRKSSESLEQLESQAKGLKSRLKTLEQQSRLHNTFKTQASTVQSVSRAYREARQKVETLAREHAQAVNPSKQLERQLAAARKTVSGLSSQYQNQKQKLAGLRAELQKNGLSNRNLNQQQNKLQAELKQTASSLEKVQKEARKSRTALKKTGFKKAARDADQARGRIERLASSFRNLVVAGTGFYVLKRAMQSVLQVGDKYERLGIQMEALMGSLAAGQQATDWIKHFTKTTPLQLDQVTQAFVTLKNFGLDPMDGTLLALVDQNAKLGGEFERLQRISLALGQAFGKQKLQGEELRQLIEAGVPAWQLLQQATGKNVQELRKLSEQGKLGADVIRALIAEMGASSVGAAQKNMSTLSGLWSNMKDRFELFAKAISESGWADYIKAQLSAVGNKLDELASNGKLQALATNIAATFIAIAESLKAFFANLTIDELVNTTTAGFQKIVDGAGTVITTFTVIGNGIQALFNSLSLVVKGAATFITGAIAQISKAAASVADALGFEELADKAQHFSDGTSAIMKAFADGVVEDANKVRTSYKNIGQAITTETPKIADTLKLAKASIEETGAGIEEANQKAGESQQQLTEVTSAEIDKVQEKHQELNVAVKETAKTTTEAGEATEQANQKMSSGGSIAQAMAEHWASLKDEMVALSPAALEAYEKINQVTEADVRTLSDDVEALKHNLSQTTEELTDMGDRFIGLDVTGLGEWMYDTRKASLQVKESFLEQKIAFEELMDTYENGEISAESFASSARKAADEMDLLDQQDLDRLNRALEQAERSMESLRNSTRSTLENLEDELDRLEGNTAAIERRRYEARKRDLEQQLKQARQSGDSQAISNLQRALSLNSQVFSRTADPRKDRERAERKNEREKRTTQTRAPRDTARQTPSKVIRLEYAGGAVDVNVRQSDEAKLLRALKIAGGRSI